MSLNLIELRTPSFVLSEMRTVDNLIKSLIADVARSQAGDVAFRDGLKNFAVEWAKFFNAHDNGVGAWFSRGTSPVYDKTKEFRHRTLAFQSMFQAAGGQISTPAVESHDRVLPWWAVAGLTAGVITLVHHKLKERQPERDDALAPRQVTFRVRR